MSPAETTLVIASKIVCLLYASNYPRKAPLRSKQIRTESIAFSFDTNLQRSNFSYFNTQIEYMFCKHKNYL